MGSLEEEKLFQMVHDFMESGSAPPIFSTSSESPPCNHHTKYLVLQEILRSNTDAESEVLKNILKHMTNIMDAEKTTSLMKWLVMRLKRGGYSASLCQTSWPTTLGCPGGDYEYIDVVMKEENGTSVRLIVDIDFKSQFELARPTSTYKELTARLPSVFVGDENKLTQIISLLCSAAKESLRERRLHIPPWRTATYMQCKWLSECHKVPVNGFSSREVGRENREAKVGGIGSPKFSNWAPPISMVKKPKRRGFVGGGGGASGLSSQFSNMSTQCC